MIYLFQYILVIRIDLRPLQLCLLWMCLVEALILYPTPLSYNLAHGIYM